MVYTYSIGLHALLSQSSTRKKTDAGTSACTSQPMLYSMVHCVNLRRAVSTAVV